MKVKSRNLFELILQILTVILVFIPGHTLYQYWIYTPEWSSTILDYIDLYTLHDESHSSFIQCAFDSDFLPMVFGLFVCALFVAGIVLYVMQFIAEGEKRNSLFTVRISCAQFISFLLCSIVFSLGDYTVGDDKCKISLSFTFYIMLGILFLLAAVTLIGYKKAEAKGILDDDPKIYKTEVINTVSTADELSKYKALLDSGVITPEEFEAKKKQLLGL